MAKVVDYEYIVEVSTADALKQAASDVSSGYNGEIPGVNTFKINAETSIYNEQGGGSGIAGWSTNINWYALDYNTVSRGSGSVYLPDGTELTVTASNTGNMSTTTYIYYDRDDDTVKTTTTASDSVGEKKILLCVAAPTVSGKDAEFQAFGCGDQSTFIHADQIAANTITGNEIAANTITASEIDSGAITTSKLAVGAVDSSAIEDGAVIADKINVSELSAITANLGDVHVGGTSGSKIRIYPYSSTQGRVEFYYNNSSVGYMLGQNISGVGNTIAITGTNIAFNGDAYCLETLRIPVGTNLYN